MSRCNTCQWWVDEEHNGMVVRRYGESPGEEFTVTKVCICWPIHEPTSPLHRCGQWRLRESLCGGVDGRTPKEPAA